MLLVASQPCRLLRRLGRDKAVKQWTAHSLAPWPDFERTANKGTFVAGLSPVPGHPGIDVRKHHHRYWDLPGCIDASVRYPWGLDAMTDLLNQD